MAGAGFYSIAKLLTQILNPELADQGVVHSADCLNENVRPADYQSREPEFESGLPQA
jgi:hypothetical protein